MSTLYLLQYNNYYNRIVKYYDTLNDYLTNIPESKRYTLTNINFFYNDNVNTVLTINYKVPEQIPEGYFDYLLVDNDNYGLSRWFIIECKWNRQGQQILTLRRDLLVDFMSSYLTQPLFAEKGCLSTLSTLTIPVISNPENMQTSQILKATYDIGGSNSIVGYIDRTYGDEKIALDVRAIYINDLSEIGLPDDMICVTTRDISNPYEVKVAVSDSATLSVASGNNYVYNVSLTSVTNSAYNPWGLNSVSMFGTTLSITDARGAVQTVLNNLAGAIFYDMYNALDDAKYAQIKPYLNVPIVYMGKIWKLTEVTSNTVLAPNVSDGVFDSICGGIKASAGMYVHYPEEGRVQVQRANIYYKVYTQTHKFALTEDTVTDSITLSSTSTRAHCGQPYDIFYMADSTKARNIASCIAARLYSSGALYDLQLLPYAPDTTNSTNQSVNYGSGTAVTLYWIKNPDKTQTITINHSTSPGNAEPFHYSSVINAKIGCICDTVRICSPNHANSWDFNPAVNIKSGDSYSGIHSWYIRMTCKPIQPYIHVRPDFTGMYSEKNDYYDDPRGLICGGSFSFPFVTDKWAQYQINNSAYYNAFNRDIENLVTTQDAQRKNEMWQMIAGTVAGAGYGAAVGSNMSGGNPYGSAIGTVAGATFSALGALGDREMNEKLRNEALDYRKDQFGFNSQNMIASPKTLANIGALNVDWHGPVYIEYYSASDTEKANIKSKLKYNGFTMNYLVRINTEGILQSGIKQLLNTAKVAHSNYVKGKLIYTTDYDDTHIFNELANEWFKGFYWEGATLT